MGTPGRKPMQYSWEEMVLLWRLIKTDRYQAFHEPEPTAPTTDGHWRLVVEREVATGTGQLSSLMAIQNENSLFLMNHWLRLTYVGKSRWFTHQCHFGKTIISPIKVLNPQTMVSQILEGWLGIFTNSFTSLCAIMNFSHLMATFQSPWSYFPKSTGQFST